MTQRDEVQKFEQGRIKALQEERLHIQKKTFTKWMNSFLLKARMEVEDLFTDLADGKKLLKLLEIISGEKLGKPNNGRMRVHKIENVNKSLAFLHTKVRLESIGAEDIVDGNPRLILGLIWTIILRFQIQEIEIDVDEENESSEKKSAKDALLLWCQRKTQGYGNVHINDFTVSWRNGMGFNALIHAHCPELFAWSELNPSRHIENLNHAFDVADDELGIPKLLDAEDVDTSRPDEKSIITYVASYYHTFARMKNEMKSGRRIANIIGKMAEADGMKSQHERLTTDLLEWIRNKSGELQDRRFPNSLEGIQALLLAFGHYRTQEKPPKYRERSEIEALYFNINAQLKSLNQPAYVPAEGQLIQDLERAWQGLERAEHERETALRTELRRQERLEQLDYKFEKKSVLREGYLKEMIQVLSDPRYGSNLGQVDATVKKHEAISADILAREERFHDLTAMCSELVREGYRGAERVRARESEVLDRWRRLLELLEAHKNGLTATGALMSLLRELDATTASVDELRLEFEEGASLTTTSGDLIVIDELIQRHALQELQVTALGETIDRLRRRANQQLPADEPSSKSRLAALESAHAALREAGRERREKLDEARNLAQFSADYDEEEAWLVERQRICLADVSAKDLRAVLSLLQKHEALEAEVRARRPRHEQLRVSSLSTTTTTTCSDDVAARLARLDEQRARLDELAMRRRAKLEEAAEAHRFHADANEAESWLLEKTALASSTDCGADETSAQALLQRHRDLQGEIDAYVGDVDNLNQLAEQLISSGAGAGEVKPPEPPQPPPQPSSFKEEWVDEVRLVPTEVWEEEPVEKVEVRTGTEERSVPQVRALYPFSGEGMVMVKGEVMFLLNKTNPDWWSVRKADGKDGFVPAKYVREIEPRIIQIQVRRPEKVRGVQRVRRTKMVERTVPVKRRVAVEGLTTTAEAATTTAEAATAVEASVRSRQSRVNDGYDELKRLARDRRALLEDAIRLFGFYRECDDFERWIRDRRQRLIDGGDDDDDVDDPDVEAARRRHDRFLTELSASAKRVEALDAALEELARRRSGQGQQGHRGQDKAKARHRQVRALWDELHRLKARKESRLQGATTVELFRRTCDEAVDWMNEKMTQLDAAPTLGPDLKTVQALQRRHRNLERELAPVEEKVARVGLLAESVRKAHPSEAADVKERRGRVAELWTRLNEKAAERRARLEDAVGRQLFTGGCKSASAWAAVVRERLAADCGAVRDVDTAKRLLKEHVDLGEEIRAKDDELAEVRALGRQLAQRDDADAEIVERLTKLETETAKLRRDYDEKTTLAERRVRVQELCREADRIDAATGGHEAFLEYEYELGGSLDDVEALRRRHDDFLKTLAAQDERARQFERQAEALIAAGHPEDASTVDERRRQVDGRRRAVRTAAAERGVALDAALRYHLFRAEADELEAWLDDKLRTAGDESYRDLTNLERKLQKHEAFERELRANRQQLGNVERKGRGEVAANDEARRPAVEAQLTALAAKWARLAESSADKGRRLRQAAAQRRYNAAVEDARRKLARLEVELRGGGGGGDDGDGDGDGDDGGCKDDDMRACKDLLKRHHVAELELVAAGQRVRDLLEQSDEMAHEGHFDATGLREAADRCRVQLEALAEPARLRRERLERRLTYHEFAFELDAQLRWIAERGARHAVATQPQDLHQAQLLAKRHDKLRAEIDGHEPSIEKTLASGAALVEASHPESARIEDGRRKLRDAWLSLTAAADERARSLADALRVQQYLSEAGEVEGWMCDRHEQLASADLGRDRDAAAKLLTRHKALELELDTYEAIVTEMGLTTRGVETRQRRLLRQMAALRRAAEQRRGRLVDSLCRHEYLAESGELRLWIRDRQQQAASEDYGQDYEHLLLLRDRFDELRRAADAAAADRFRQCDELARKLVQAENEHASDVRDAQEALERDWSRLLELLEHRDRKLTAAAEVHLFHRDAAEAASRVHEKDAALGTELGRDLRTATALLRRHEGFENDLVALEAQLQLLVDDAARLRALYPSNAAAIGERHDAVVAAYDRLRSKTEARRDALRASCDLQRFLSQVRDLTGWSSGLRRAMTSAEDGGDLPIAKTEHEALRGEIEAREDSFRAALDLGETMVGADHYAARDVDERCAALVDERRRLHEAWHARKLSLDRQYDLHCFLRDAKQLEHAAVLQEASVVGGTDDDDDDDDPITVEEAETRLRRHEAFEKLVAAQDEKARHFERQAETLMADAIVVETVTERLREVSERRRRVAEACDARRKRLEAALRQARFVRDADDVASWISERTKRLAAATEAEGGGTLSDEPLELKAKRLQKHRAELAELAANEATVANVVAEGRSLEGRSRRADRLEAAWMRLLTEAERRGRGLEEAQDTLEFNSQLDEIEAWMRDKEMMVQARDVGRDYEHCVQLRRKLDDADSDMRVDDARVRAVGQLADRLASEAALRRRDAFVERLRRLQDGLAGYRAELDAALEVHQFDRDVADTQQRMSEKAAAFASEETGRDLAAVEELRRRHDALERDATAVERRLDEHDAEARRLAARHGDGAASRIRQLVLDLGEAWTRLAELRERRRRLLDESRDRHRFLTDVADLELWTAERIQRMDEAIAQPARTKTEAEARLLLHAERRAEIEGKAAAFSALDSAERVRTLRRDLENAWTECDRKLAAELRARAFDEQADQAESWLAAKEAYLNNDDLGDSAAAVEALARKHDDFESAAFAQWSRLSGELEESRARDDSDDPVTDRLARVLDRGERLRGTCAARRRRLLEAARWHEFMRDVYEVESWLGRKMQIAADESYREPTNLRSKIQRHAAFEAELEANEVRLAAVAAAGERLLSEGHFAAAELRAQIDWLAGEWARLRQTARLKRDRLTDAHAALQIARQFDDLNAWAAEAEAQLASTDVGRDPTSAAHLLRKHAALEEDLARRRDACDVLCETARRQVIDRTKPEEHFMRTEIGDRARSLDKRMRALESPARERRERLEDARLLHQFVRDADDELRWLEERLPSALSADAGAGLAQARGLRARHGALEAELAARESNVVALAQRSRALAAAATERQTRLEDLFGRVREAAAVRRVLLTDAVDAHAFRAEADEADAWLSSHLEKARVAAAAAATADEDSIRATRLRAEADATEIAAFETTTLAKLRATADALVARRHPEATAVEERRRRTVEACAVARAAAEERARLLVTAGERCASARDCDELVDWINEKVAVAASEDYGTDVEHVELLMQAFEAFADELDAAETRVYACAAEATRLGDETAGRDLEQRWRDLRELAAARRDALAGARQVHTFDRGADETAQWIDEKLATLDAEPDRRPTDIEDIQASRRRTEAFRDELGAVRDSVDRLDEEARRLGELFPDARDHIVAKRDEARQRWAVLLDETAARTEALERAERLQTHFDLDRDLLAWCSEMLAKVTAADLARDVRGAEALLARHDDYRTEMDARDAAFADFYARCETLNDDDDDDDGNHSERASILRQRRRHLEDAWNERRRLYVEHLDALRFKRDADALDDWLADREARLRDEETRLGETVRQVEELLRKHDDFEQAVEAQRDRFEALNRITLLEQAFRQRRDRERAEIERRERENRKRDEMERLSADRGRTRPPLLPHAHSFLFGRTTAAAAAAAAAATQNDVKRAESVRIPAAVRKTPSFNTRRRADSFRGTDDRRNQQQQQHDKQPPPPSDVRDFLERKHLATAGGRRATSRSWKTVYAVLCGQLLCFFKNADDFADRKACAPPVSIHRASCAVADDYTKRKHAFRLACADSSEFMFAAPDAAKMRDWINKISFHASLAPSQQLTSYDAFVRDHQERSSASSRASSPDQPRPKHPDEPPPPVPPRAPIVSRPQPQPQPQPQIDERVQLRHRNGDGRRHAASVSVSVAGKTPSPPQDLDELDRSVGWPRPATLPAEGRASSVSSTDSDHATNAQPKKQRMLSGLFNRKKKTTSQM